jgi:hypothetical protein
VTSRVASAVGDFVELGEIGALAIKGLTRSLGRRQQPRRPLRRATEKQVAFDTANSTLQLPVRPVVDPYYPLFQGVTS